MNDALKIACFGTLALCAIGSLMFLIFALICFLFLINPWFLLFSVPIGIFFLFFLGFSVLDYLDDKFLY
jgi:hypothetical protein